MIFREKLSVIYGCSQMIVYYTMDKSDIDMLQRDLHSLEEWAVENVMKINPGKSKAKIFLKAKVKEE